ncbi:MAG: phosphate ABC transporter permease subunit PstC [Myxococcales bacterium]|nr:phosphate ABC transporter permease subunit PstC [Myxococcales bacterium]
MAKDALELQGTGGGADQAFRWGVRAAAAMVLVVLAMVALSMTSRSGDVLGVMGLDFFGSRRWSEADELYGALPFLWGTLYTAVIAIVLAVPVSLGVALFVTQVAPPWLKKPMIYVLDLLAVVPSVVFGLWGVMVLSGELREVYLVMHRAVDWIPVLGDILGPSPQGRSFMTAGVILAIMITPIITSLSREVIETTPPGDKEAALALGATRWEMIRASVLPHSKGGLVAAVMLGLGRAMGETIAAALVIGSALGQTGINAFASGNSMPAVIANEWGEANDLHKSALVALAMTLFLLTIVINLSASAIVRRSMVRGRGAST